MKLIRVIKLKEIKQSIIHALDQFGFTLVYSQGALKIYQEVQS